MPLAAIEFQNPARDVVEEAAIVGDGDDGAGNSAEPFQPKHRVRIEVVGRFVEEQHVGPFQSTGTARRDDVHHPKAPSHLGPAAAGAAHPSRFRAAVRYPTRLWLRFRPGRGFVLLDELVHFGGGRVFTEPHRQFFEPFEQIEPVFTAMATFSKTFLFWAKLRFLRQITDANSVGGTGLALEFVVDARHDAQKRTFARAVRADDADLGAQAKRQPDPLMISRCGGTTLRRFCIVKMY